MPWRETCVMDERMGFIAACLEGRESVSELCRQYGVSRKTGNKWLSRYRSEGVVGLGDRPRCPHSNARALPGDVVEAVLSVRRRYPSWGPRKVKAFLEAQQPRQSWPAASTIGDLFDRTGLTRPRKRRRRVPPQTAPLAACRRPNDVWCADFKGWFVTGDGSHVEPFTLSDGHSRFLLCCQAVARTDGAHVWPLLEAAFYDYGLPWALRSDNGAPFASRGAGGLSRFAVKLIKAGVLPERIEAGKPQQNGRHERLHLTLKQDTASPPARSLAEQIERFESFREIYNTQRPHEALGQVPPGQVYKSSPRQFDGVLRSPDYPAEAQVRRVRSNGEIKWQGNTVFLSEALVGEPVGLFAVGANTWLVKYGPIVLGAMKGRDHFVRIGAAQRPRANTNENETGKLSPISSG
jgi:putative transposase